MKNINVDTLEHIWGDEWNALTIAQQIVVVADWASASAEMRDKYVSNIYRGNLAKYANTLLVDAAKDWAKKVTA